MLEIASLVLKCIALHERRIAHGKVDRLRPPRSPDPSCAVCTMHAGVADLQLPTDMTWSVWLSAPTRICLWSPLTWHVTIHSGQWRTVVYSTWADEKHPATIGIYGVSANSSLYWWELALPLTTRALLVPSAKQGCCWDLSQLSHAGRSWVLSPVRLWKLNGEVVDCSDITI